MYIAMSYMTYTTYFANGNAHIQILRTVKDFARSFRPLAAKPRTVIAYERFCSHPVKLNSKRQKRRPLRQIAARLQAVPCVICLQ